MLLPRALLEDLGRLVRHPRGLKTELSLASHLSHELGLISVAVGDRTQGITQVAEHLGAFGGHDIEIDVRGVTGGAERIGHVMAQLVRARWELADLDESSVAEAVIDDHARFEEDARHDDQPAIHTPKVTPPRGS